MSHTPGPWHRNIPPAAKYPTIFSGRNTHVAVVQSFKLPDEQVEANANLIAAAPELLYALKRLLFPLRPCAIPPEHEAEHLVLCGECVARAAIAKAEAK